MKLWTLILPSTFLLLAGCVQLASVQQYAATAQATMASVRPVAADFHLSCVRTNSYKPLAAQSECLSEAEATRAIKRIAQVLDDYVAALGALAADELVVYTTDVDALTAEVAKAPLGLDKQQVDAIGSLAKVVAKAATSAYQQRQIGSLLDRGDPSVAAVAAVLAELLEINYARALDLELSAWRDNYRAVERVARTEQPIAWQGYSRSEWQTRSVIEAKRDAARQLAQGIRALAATHTRLLGDAADLSGAEALAAARSFVKETKPVLKEIQDAF